MNSSKKLPGYSKILEGNFVTFIPLTKQKYAIVDIEDGIKLIDYHWQAGESNSTPYARRKIYKDKKLTSRFMHHDIFPKKEGFVHDHINGDGLDNRRKNLRYVTVRQNAQNHQTKRYTSKYPGVCWDKSRKKWMASIQIKGKRRTLGRRDSEDEAYSLYKRELIKLGELL